MEHFHILGQNQSANFQTNQSSQFKSTDTKESLINLGTNIAKMIYLHFASFIPRKSSIVHCSWDLKYANFASAANVLLTRSLSRKFVQRIESSGPLAFYLNFYRNAITDLIYLNLLINWAFPGLFFALYSSFQTLTVNMFIVKLLLMTGFEPQTSDIRIDRKPTEAQPFP